MRVLRFFTLFVFPIASVLTSLGFVGFYWASLVKVERFYQVVDALEEGYEWAAPAALSNQGWFHWRDVVTPRTREVWVQRIAEHFMQQVDQLAPPLAASTQGLAGHFNHYAQKFSQLESLCYRVRRYLPERVAGCDHFTGLMSEPWRQAYGQISDEYYLDKAQFGELALFTREHYSLRLCGLAPVAMKVAVATDLLSQQVADVSFHYLDKPLGVRRVEGWEALEPGQCTLKNIRLYDLEPEFAFLQVPQDPAYYEWVYEHLPQGGSEQAQLPPTIELCAKNGDFAYLMPQADSPCREDMAKQSFQYVGYQTGPSAWWLVSQMPNYVVFDPYHSNHNDFEQVLAQMAEYAVFVRSQYQLAQAWKSKVPRYVLGYDAGDDEVLVHGVDYRGFAARSIFGEDQSHIPSRGRLLAINNVPVHSIHGVYSALEQHGDRLALGIKEPIAIAIESCDAEGCQVLQTIARYRFNTNARQAFDTHNASLSVLTTSAFLNSAAINCGLTQGLSALATGIVRLFDDSVTPALVNIPQCQWRTEQRIGWAYQTSPGAARASEFAGSVLTPLSFLARAKPLAKMMGIKKLGLKRIVVLSSIEAMEGVAWDLNQQRLSPITPEQLRLNAGVGFGIGAIANTFFDSRLKKK